MKAARTHIDYLSIASYSFIQLNELEQCIVKKLAQGFNTAAQDSNPGPLSQKSEALPLVLHLADFTEIIYRGFRVGYQCFQRG